MAKKMFLLPVEVIEYPDPNYVQPLDATTYSERILKSRVIYADEMRKFNESLLPKDKIAYEFIGVSSSPEPVSEREKWIEECPIHPLKDWLRREPKE